MERRRFVERIVQKFITNTSEGQPKISTPSVRNEGSYFLSEEKVRFERANREFKRIEEQQVALKNTLKDIEEERQRPKLIDIPPEFGDKLPPHP